MGFNEWLKTVCFQKPTKEAYDLAKSAWNEALSAASAQCEEIKGKYDMGYAGVAAQCAEAIDELREI